MSSQTILVGVIFVGLVVLFLSLTSIFDDDDDDWPKDISF